MSKVNVLKQPLLVFLKLCSFLLGTMLSMLFGCRIGPTPIEYGMPHADFKISGTVLSADQNQPIKGLSVTIRDTVYHWRAIDSTKTDSLGRYSLQFCEEPYLNTWNLEFVDVDSTENGSFRSKDTIISIPENELKDPSDSWYKGHAEKIVDKMIFWTAGTTDMVP